MLQFLYHCTSTALRVVVVAISKRLLARCSLIAGITGVVIVIALRNIDGTAIRHGTSFLVRNQAGPQG